MSILGIILLTFRAILGGSTRLALENLALCLQLAVLKRSDQFHMTHNRRSV